MFPSHDRNRHSTTLAPNILGVRSKSDTAAHTAVADGDILFSLAAGGFDGDTYSLSSRMSFEVDGAVSDNVMPGKMTFNIAPPGSRNPQLAMTIHSDKHVRMESTLNVENQVTAENFYAPAHGEVAYLDQLSDGTINHGDLSGLTGTDHHTRYAHLTGRSGGQTLIGGTGAADDLDLDATSHATTGNINLNDEVQVTPGTVTYDVTNGYKAFTIAPTIDGVQVTTAANLRFFDISPTINHTANYSTGFGQIAAINLAPVFQDDGLGAGSDITTINSIFLAPKYNRTSGTLSDRDWETR